MIIFNTIGRHEGWSYFYYDLASKGEKFRNKEGLYISKVKRHVTYSNDSVNYY